MDDYVYTLTPFTDEDLILPEAHLLRVLRELDRMGRLDEQTIYIYEGRADARTYVGTADASSVLDAGGVSETLIET